jgi:hypothetical protein
MPHVVYDKGHHAGPDAEARIKSRLKSSGGHGQSTETHPTRTHTHIHHGQPTPAQLYGTGGEIIRKEK